MVVGSAQGVLTVAITDRQNTTAIESLRKITGQAIFPVLIDPDRMRLLIRRIERSEQNRQAFSSTTRQAREQAYYLSVKRELMVSSILMLLVSQRISRTW